MQAIINNVSYHVLGHYAEQGGMARLILQGKDISFDELQTNIEEAEEILITNEENQIVATYVGYTKIRQLSVTLTEDNQFQIELALEAENAIASIENAQKKIMNNTQAIENLSNSIEEIREQLASIQESIETILNSTSSENELIVEEPAE